MGMPLKPIPNKHCEQCGVKMERKRWPGGRIQVRSSFIASRFCSVKCNGLNKRKDFSEGSVVSGNKMARRRVPEGPCMECGASGATEIHHKNKNPRDNRAVNLVRLCVPCHKAIHNLGPRYCMACGKKSTGRGYCQKHYRRFMLYGDPGKVLKPRQGAKCLFCDSKPIAKNLCNAHYKSERKRLKKEAANAS